MATPLPADPLQAENVRLRQENERLWKENSELRPRVSDLSHKLAVAIAHLKAQAEAETATLVRKDSSDHG